MAGGTAVRYPVQLPNCISARTRYPGDRVPRRRTGDRATAPRPSTGFSNRQDAQAGPDTGTRAIPPELRVPNTVHHAGYIVRYAHDGPARDAGIAAVRVAVPGGYLARTVTAYIEILTQILILAAGGAASCANAEIPGNGYPYPVPG